MRVLKVKKKKEKKKRREEDGVTVSCSILRVKRGSDKLRGREKKEVALLNGYLVRSRVEREPPLSNSSSLAHLCSNNILKCFHARVFGTREYQQVSCESQFATRR